MTEWPKGTRLIIRRQPLHPGTRTSLLPDLEYRFWLYPDHMRSDGRFLGVVLGLGILVSACGGTGWTPTPDGPIGPRAFAAVACSRDGMTIVGGATPRTTEQDGVIRERIATGTAFLGPDGWASIPDPPIEPRTEAAAAAADEFVMVWGGRDGTISGSQTSDFTYYSDGAVLDLVSGTWKPVSPSPLAPRANAQIVALRDGFVVAGGTASMGPDVDRSAQAALYSLSSDSWLPLNIPDDLGVLAGGQRLLNFDSSSVDEYDFAAESWKPIEPVPEEAAGLVWASTRGTVTAVATDSRVWLFDNTFVALPEVSGSRIDYLGWVGDSVAVWNNSEGVLSVYNTDQGDWVETSAPEKYNKRISPALCASDTGFSLWGGWIERDAGAFGVRIASDSGTTHNYDQDDG